MIIRLIQDTDWPAILAIQEVVYPDITPESEDVLRSKIALGRDTCIVATDHQNHITGYCLAHPWSDKPASLHTLYTPPDIPLSLYIHDMAIAPQYAGTRIGSQIFYHLVLWAKTQKLPQISLISLAQAITYWKRLGFKDVPYDVDASQYGAGARYMLKTL